LPTGSFLGSPVDPIPLGRTPNVLHVLREVTMQPHFSRALLLLSSLIACLFVIASPLLAQQAPVLVTQAVDDSVRTVLPGNVHPMARAEFDQGEAPLDLPLHRMLLVLKRSDQQEAALQRLIENQQNKKSASYHKWLTPEEFGASFGPADSDIAAVTNWLLASGFQVTQVSNGCTVIEFNGTAGQVKQAFGTAIHRFVVNGEEHWANVSNPSIPTALAPVVAGIDSLHNFLKQAHNSYVGKYSEKTKQLDSPKPEYSFAGCGGECYAVSPFDFATIYDLLPLWTATTPINGTGVTIAIVGRTDIYTGDPSSTPPIPSDAVAFWTMFGLGQNGVPMPTLKITTNGPDPGFTGDEPEADIDTQWSGAAAPGATVNYVTSASTETTDGVDLSALYIVDNNLAPVMSESYGNCEANLGSAANFYGAIWEQAAAQGITAMVSTGDNGSAGCDDPNTEAYAVSGLAVSGLASTPWNVAVGGTDFNQYKKWSTYWNNTNDTTTQQSVKPNTYIPETTWNDSCTNLLLESLTGGTSNPETNCNNSIFSSFLDISAGSGGASALWLKPTWQTGNGVPQDNARDLPDVSLFASNDFLGSFYVICQSDEVGGTCNLGNLRGYGGTSVASPAFAGIMALVNQQWGRQGNANLVLYNLSSKQPTAFHDVPTGSTDDVPCLSGKTNCTITKSGDTYGLLTTNGSTDGYNTGTGFDLAAGLGSVDANVLVTNWNKASFTPSTTALTLNVPANTTHGALVPVTVSVTPASPTPTGDVALLVAPKPGTPGFDSHTLTNGTASWPTSLLPGGTYQVIAHYEGDTTYGASYSSPSASFTINRENSSVYMPGVVTGTDGNGNPVYSTSVVYASPYLLRADVQNAQGKFCNPPRETACPTGTVAFTDNGNPLDAGTYTLNSYGYTEDQTLQLQGGTHTLAAQYGGDPSFNLSSASVQVTVTPASTSMGNLYLSNPVAENQLFASVYVNSASTGVAPTGTVTFYVNGTLMTGPVQYTLYNGHGDFYANLNAVINTTVSPFPTPGTYTISASYSGNANYSASTVVGQAVNVKFPMPGIRLQPSSYSVPAGTTLTLTATVGGISPTIAPTGTLTFNSQIYGQLSGTPTYTTITDQNGNLDLQATVSYTINASDNFGVTYSGDANYPGASGSNGVTVTGSDFTLTFPSQTTMTVTPGAYGQLNNLAVGMQSGTAPVTFSATPCSGMPAESTCGVAPVSVTYTSNVQVNVTTTAPHQVASNRPADGRTPGPWAMSFGLGIASILLIGRPRRRSALLAIALCAFLVGEFGCGGGGNSGGGGSQTDPGTPAGTYTITVTGTSGSTTHTATFTLNVQ
jgi:subtilase family serine protease